MFTGIIEEVGKVISLDPENANLHITLTCNFLHELKIDQSISHNGACLTVVNLDESSYRVTAVSETLRKTNLGLLNSGDLVNLERSMKLNGRIDGHMVQGHIDNTAVCTYVNDLKGSWQYGFEYDDDADNITVAKGSVCVNGVSLTVVDAGKNNFSVVIIPYTFHNTNFKNIIKGSVVNVEFDIIGKYIGAYMRSRM